MRYQYKPKRSRRQKRRQRHADQEKDLRAVLKEEATVLDSLRNTGVEELPEPLFRGYAKEFKIRDDYTRRADASVFQRLLNIVQNTIYCRRKDFMEPSYTTNKTSVEMSHRPVGLSYRQYFELDPDLKQYFSEKLPRYSNGHLIYSNYAYELHFTTWIDYKITKYYATHRYVYDAVLIKRQDEIDNKQTTHHMYPRIKQLNHWDCYDEWKRDSITAQRRSEARELNQLKRDIEGTDGSEDAYDYYEEPSDYYDRYFHENYELYQRGLYKCSRCTNIVDMQDECICTKGSSILYDMQEFQYLLNSQTTSK